MFLGTNQVNPKNNNAWTFRGKCDFQSKEIIREEYSTVHSNSLAGSRNVLRLYADVLSDGILWYGMCLGC